MKHVLAANVEGPRWPSTPWAFTSNQLRSTLPLMI